MRDKRTKKQLPEELGSPAQLLETVSGGITDQILLLSSDLQVLWANKTALSEHSYRELKEITGSYCYQISHHCDSPCNDQLHPCPISQVQKTGEPVTVTHTHADTAGNQTFVEVTASPISDKKGEIIQFIHVSRDVTERKRAEEALRASEERYRSLMENLPVGITINTMDGHSTFRNRTGAQMHGYDSMEEYLKVPGEALYFDLKDRERFFELAKEGLIRDYEVRRKRRDGTAFWVSMTAIPDRAKSEIITVTQDITERKRAEEALKASEERYRNLIENLPVGLAVATFDGRLLQRNKELYRMLGFQSQEESLAAPVLETYSDPEDRRRFFEVAKAGPIRDYEIRRRRKDGTVFWASMTAIPDKANEEIITVSQDITERKEAEEAIRQANTELTAVNKELEAFSYSVSHDLRAPLRTLDGFSQILLEDYADKLDAEGKDYLVRVRTASQRMADLIDDILGLSQVIRAQMHQETVNLSRLANAIALELRRAEPGRQVDFVVQDSLTVSGDTRLLRIMLQDLLGNAWKYTGKHPSARIEFGMKEEAGKPVFFVSDDGAGFDMKYVDKLFQPFQRLHSLADFPGTGIGLATVQRIINRHGGRVWAKGEVEKGATFYFTLG